MADVVIYLIWIFIGVAVVLYAIRFFRFIRKNTKHLSIRPKHPHKMKGSVSGEFQAELEKQKAILRSKFR